MHKHAHLHHRELADREASPDVTTQPNGRVVSVVYVTAVPTFTGVLGAPKTVTSGDDDEDVQQTTSVKPNAKGTSTANSIILGDPVQATGTESSESSMPQQTLVISTTTQEQDAPSNPTTSSMMITTSSSLAGSSTSQTTSRHSSSSSSRTGVAGSSATGASSSSSTDSTSEGMSTGGKVGLAAGIIAMFGLFAILALLFLKKKRAQRERELKIEDEKKAAAAATAAATAQPKNISPQNAPRLSLRPMSRLAPDLMSGQRSKSRLSQVNTLAPVHESGRPRQQPGRENPFTDPANPFADPEKAAAAAAVASPQLGGSPPSTNYQQPPHTQAHELEDTRSMSSTAPSTPQLQTSQTPPAQYPAQMAGPNGVVAPMPPTSSSAAAANGPGAEAQSNVYRILMDFIPTMEDELELRAGQLVRLLHEYDDGWALCIRLDRSQQGVVPRTCLAAKPSKPRPNNGARPKTPNGPGPQRQGPPPNMYHNAPGPRMNGSAPGSPMPGGPRSGTPQSRPMSPAHLPRGIPSTSPTGTFNQAPRPLSPGPRPQQSAESPILGGPSPAVSTPGPSKQGSPSQIPASLSPGAHPARSNSPGVAM